MTDHGAGPSGGTGELIDRWDAAVRATSDDPPETFLQPPCSRRSVTPTRTWR
jgi:hypothetical protein